VVDTTRYEYHARWLVSSKITLGDAAVSFIARTFWPTTGIDIPRLSGNTWIHGLHGRWAYRTTRPDGKYRRAPGDLLNEVAYRVGEYRLRFGSYSGNHHPGASALTIQNHSLDLWKWNGDTPRTYTKTSDNVPTQTAAVIVAVQRYGDANLDGRVDGADVSAFAMAKNNPGFYAIANFGVPATFNCDIDGDGAITADDEYWFSVALVHGGMEGDYWDQVGYNDRPM